MAVAIEDVAADMGGLLQRRGPERAHINGMIMGGAAGGVAKTLFAGKDLCRQLFGFAPGGRLIPSFPYHDPASSCSANAKARHLAPYRARHRIIFAGDGHSDLDAALAANVVFAKSTLEEFKI